MGENPVVIYKWYRKPEHNISAQEKKNEEASVENNNDMKCNRDGEDIEKKRVSEKSEEKKLVHVMKSNKCPENVKLSLHLTMEVSE